jgi:hypothetical protein
MVVLTGRVASATDLCSPRCNVEATILGGYLELGQQGVMGTVGGYTFAARVNSLGSFNNDGVQLTEFGWSIHRCADGTLDGYHWFYAWQTTTTFNEWPYPCTSDTGLTQVSGSHTYSVDHRYDGYRGSYDWFFVLDGTTAEEPADFGWSIGHPYTNEERHSTSDSWTTGPVFGTLQFKSSSGWYAWAGGKCFQDNDPDLQNFFINNQTIQVALGGANCP